ncbi:hypothetical protein C882_3346 [Caenispirillum salinarum AK4]|uniref:Capsule polysaccharide biosynthesis protein n=1 Tax=Caenispirillum salinarum AK4 TaxID=1238182 RepID=K9GN18_9PROT|nr:hypothetical protein [Caenispirillum salinarum]EKV26059.1 hypothetical protein C882_3346 [Caenispirillum salinarum AK4]
MALDPRTKENLKRLLRRTGLSRWARAALALRPAARAARRRDEAELAALREQLAAVRAQIEAAAAGQDRTALVIGMGGVAYIAQQLPVLAGVVAAGFAPVVVLPSRGNTQERRIYESCGITRFAYWEDQAENAEADVVLESFSRCRTQDDVLALSWQGIAVGKYAVSTLMRRLRQGHIDVADPQVRAHMEVALRRTLDHTAAGMALIESWRPDLGVFVDRGYTPEGPLFEICIAAGIRPITFNAAHRDNTLMLKRYGPDNANVHPSSLSDDTWTRLRAMTWTDAHWDSLRGELEHCYGSGQWYGEVGTQFNTRMLDRNTVLTRLELDPAKKTVLLFPHIFWDATFFWGRDVFRDYADWFRESVRAAWENDRVNWIIKVHPANVVKNQRDGIDGQFSEMEVLSEFGPVPPHIRVLPPDTEISTLSLFSVGDVCLTVRGTVGIEAAMLGLTVLTAGTGRYDGLGFTDDITTPDAWRQRLARIEETEPPAAETVELARRYAYGVFLARPLEMGSVCFRYAQQHGATLEVEVRPEAAADLMACDDIRAMAGWLRSGAQDCVTERMIAAPEEEVQGQVV